MFPFRHYLWAGTDGLFDHGNFRFSLPNNKTFLNRIVQKYIVMNHNSKNIRFKGEPPELISFHGRPRLITEYKAGNYPQTD